MTDMKLIVVNYRSVCDCKSPWTAHPEGFQWHTSGADLKHIIEAREEKDDA